jgi:hypothetical protein
MHPKHETMSIRAKYLFPSVIFFSFFLVSCLSSKNGPSGPDAKRDGLSYETAVIINEKHEGTGVKAEYKWLKEHYPGYTSKGQSLTYHDRKPYDVISIELENGEKKEIYFDISKFFGKF